MRINIKTSMIYLVDLRGININSRMIQFVNLMELISKLSSYAC